MKILVLEHLKRLFVWLLPLFFLLGPSHGFAHDETKYHFLVLHSYNKGLTWTDNIQKGIEDTFKPMAHQLEMKVEYMDSKIVKFDDQFKIKLYELYKHKYSKSKFEVIIVSDDNALTFIREYHKDLFPDTPIVFCGINNVNIPSIVDRNLFTGILEVTAQNETLDLALQLHPQTKKVVIICGDTPSGKARWKQIEGMIKDYPNLQFSRFDSSYTLEEIEEKVKNLSDDTIGMFATFYRDRTEQFISLEEGVRRVTLASRRPMYTYHAQVVQFGTVGGKVLGGGQHGNLAAKIAQKVFRGQAVKDIPVVDESLAQYMFNYRELKRFAVDLSKLPKDSVIINQPFSFYNEYKSLVWLTCVFALFLVSTIIVMAINITKRMKAEDELLREKERVQNYLDIAATMILALNAEGEVTLVNRRGCDILGYDEKDILGKNWFDHFIPAHFRDKVRGIFGKLMAGEIEAYGDVDSFTVMTSSGQEKYLHWYNSLIRDSKSKIIGTLSSGTDITERKKAEEEKELLESQLRQVQKVEAIGTMAGGIAHDFNNILAAILGYAEMAKDDVPASSSAFNNIEQVLKAGLRAKDLVSHILTFSRMSGQPKAYSPLNIAAIVQEELKFHRSIIPSTIEIRTNIDEGCGLIAGDPTQIHQVLMNFCTNATYAMEEQGGILTVSLRQVTLAQKDLKTEPALSSGKYANLSVSDTGTGIEPELIDKIFDPYFTTKEVGKGSGMGLSVVQSIIKRHGGFIRAESILGRGSTFDVFLPVIQEEIIEGNYEQEAALQTGSERILFVDDEKLLANLGKSILEGLGYSVTALSDSTEALELFKNDPGRFDLVITDQTMPNIEGAELAKKFLVIRPDIPIILCTGFSGKIDELRAHEIGIRAYTMKPVEKEELSRLVRKVLDGD